MQMMTQALSAALLHFVWEGAIVGVVLGIALFVLRHRSANARYTVSCAALIVLAALPIITTAVLYSQALSIDTRGIATILGGSRPTADVLLAEAPVRIGSELPQIAWLAQVQMWALPLWSAGVLLFSVRLLFGSAYVFVLGRRGAPAEASLLATVVRLAARMGIDRAVRVLISTRIDVPSAVGWLRPVILLPPATAMGLTPQQLEAVLAHELAHIRRHDYVVNILQMVVETMLFYHPVVWWTSKQIRLERELCCDDLAVRCCGDALCYARALTTLEQLRATSPSLAMSSTGGPLIHRIHRLLGTTSRRDPSSRWPAAIAFGLAVACVALDVSWVRAHTSTPVRPAFEVASIKPNASGGRPGPAWFKPNNTFTTSNTALLTLIELAYHLVPDKGFVTGLPKALESARFDIEAKAPDGAIPPGQTDRQRVDTMKLMLQRLLEERFKLTAHLGAKEMPIYELVATGSATKLGKRTERDCMVPAQWCHKFQGGSGWGIDGQGVSMLDLSEFLTRFTDRVVRDRTGISGEFDIRTTGWADPRRRPADGAVEGREEPLDPLGPSLFTVVQEQLGLKLESTKGPVETFVIVHVERPTED
jgi:uncharacterized protein (TIGR03435 family)